MVPKFARKTKRKQKKKLNHPNTKYLPIFMYLPVFGLFLENFDKKIAFFWRVLPSKIVGNGAKSAFRKILVSVGQKWIS